MPGRMPARYYFPITGRAQWRRSRCESARREAAPLAGHSDSRGSTGIFFPQPWPVTRTRGARALAQMENYAAIAFLGGPPLRPATFSLIRSSAQLENTADFLVSLYIIRRGPRPLRVARKLSPAPFVYLPGYISAPEFELARTGPSESERERERSLLLSLSLSF